MRVDIPNLNTKQELFSYLKANVKDLIKQKKSMPIPSDDFSYGCKSLKFPDKGTAEKSAFKAEVNTSLKPDELQVDVITNLMGWCDSHHDVLIRDSAKKTIAERGASNKQLIYHLKNHMYSTDAIVGKQVTMYLEDVDLSQFNITSDIVKSQALIGSSIVSKSYDEKTYQLYCDDEVKQHSIGLRYIKLFLCINSTDEDYKEEKANWDKYYSNVINKGHVDSIGFFWAVTEFKLLEYSTVLFGSNELTTVQSTSKDIEPPEGTQKPKPSEDTSKEQLAFYKHLN